MSTRPSRQLRGLALVGVLVPALALSACSASSIDSSDGESAAAPSDGVLTVGLLGDIGQPPDPDIYYANNGQALILNTYEGLVQYKMDGDAIGIAPRLATSWRPARTTPSSRSTCRRA